MSCDTTFASPATAECECAICGAPVGPPRLAINDARVIVWQIPRCDRCHARSYEDGVSDGIREAAREEKAAKVPK